MDNHVGVASKLSEMMPRDALAAVSAKMKDLRARKYGRGGKCIGFNEIRDEILRRKGIEYSVTTLFLIECQNISKWSEDEWFDIVINIGETIGAFGKESPKKLESDVIKTTYFDDNPIWDRMTRRMSELNLSGSDIETLSHGLVKKSWIYSMKSRPTAAPTGRIVATMAELLNTTPQWLLTGKGGTINAESQRLAQAISSFSGEQREVLCAIVNIFQNRNRKKDEKPYE